MIRVNTASQIDQIYPMEMKSSVKVCVCVYGGGGGGGGGGGWWTDPTPPAPNHTEILTNISSIPGFVKWASLSLKLQTSNDENRGLGLKQKPEWQSYPRFNFKSLI